ncbi:MAG: HAMP domain-containing histidine kinase [Dactylosporangium sp.]|nr:HAMP domain-containing histidine kinase [Dactylosporangium sp.]NNJ60130.1 HAMP domain-containing histidine kinase [Dactylosporangium sp.]
MPALGPLLLRPVQLASGTWASVHTLWRRSLQFRIVSVTLVLSALLVGAFSWTVAGVITNGLLAAKIKTSERLVLNGGAYAASQLTVVNQRDDPALLTTVPAVVTQLATAPALGGQKVQVVMLRSRGDLSLAPEAVAQPDTGAYDVVRSPQLAALRARVAGDHSGEGRVTYQYVTISPDGQPARQYLAFGTPVDTFGGQLELYYLFPLEDQVAQVNLVRSTLGLTGVALVALLAILAAMITRMVVRPVRVAARTAQRLSAGLLDQRIQVKGEDDLAQLASAFNQMAENLQSQIVRLEEMSRLQRRFTSDVSHELRTPLTTVRMAADLIFASREEFAPAVARSAELLSAELDRFEGLLTDLLEISRFDAGFAALDAEHVDLVPILVGAVDRLASLADQVGVKVMVHVPDTPVIVEIDPRRVERILRNLLGNALEHSEGQPVAITLGTSETAVAVTIRDYGIGLKTGEEQLVFNRFWRADPSRARQTGGTGLGLSISLEDARLHNGWLDAWGAPGEGAQFRLTVPVRIGDHLVESPLPRVPMDAEVTR